MLRHLFSVRLHHVVMFAATMILVIHAVPAHAQAVTGTLLGNVSDASGAAVPGATVTATEVQTNDQPDGGHATRPATTSSPACRTARTRSRPSCRASRSSSGRTSRSTSTRPCASISMLEVGPDERGGDGPGRDAGAADRPDRHRAPHRVEVVDRDRRSASTATSRACWSRCPAPRGRTASTRQFFNSQDCARASRSTDSRGWPTTR